MNKKKLLAVGAAVLTSVAIIVTGTFAWFSAEETVLNNFNTKSTTNVDLVEDFDEDKAQDFKPGAEVDKKVSVVNTGDADEVVRVRLEEFLQVFEPAADGKNIKIYNNATSTTPAPSGGTFVPVTMTADAVNAKLKALGFITSTQTMADATKVIAANLPAGCTADVYVKTTVNGLITTYEYIAFQTVGTEYQVCDLVVNATTKTKIDTVTYQFKKQLPAENSIHLLSSLTHIGTPDHSLITLNFNGTAVKPISAWTTADDCWYYDTDGWVYYGQKLAGGTSSATMLERVDLSGAATGTLDGMQYKINVRMQATQVTGAAVNALWASGTAIAAKTPTPDFEMLGTNTMTAAAKAMMATIIGEAIA